MNFNFELADVLDKLAAQVDREAATPAPAPAKVAAAPSAPERSRAEKLSELVQSATGQEMPSDVAERIASDASLFEHVTKLAEYGARPSAMGEAVTKEGSAEPTTKREKIASAWANWNASVLNDR